MGDVFQSLRIKENRKAIESVEVTCQILGGPQFTVVASDILYKLGIEPYRELVFEIGIEDEQGEDNIVEVSRKVGDAYFEIDEIGATSPVVFGEEGDVPILGEVTIASLGLQVSSSDNTLEPMDMILG